MKPALSLTTDPIPRLTRQIALPMSIGMLFNTLFNVVDTFRAGWLGLYRQLIAPILVFHLLTSTLGWAYEVSVW